MLQQGPLIRPLGAPSLQGEKGQPRTDAAQFRTHIVALAREWLGTPYHHQASLKGVGTDCVGLVRGIWREVYAGDVLVFRWRRHTLAKHCAVLSKPVAMIHALEGAPVSEVAFTPWWRRHVAGAFAFPSTVQDDSAERENAGAGE
jgi:cell wall-associated NlpC family hydrolase